MFRYESENDYFIVHLWQCELISIFLLISIFCLIIHRWLRPPPHLVTDWIELWMLALEISLRCVSNIYSMWIVKLFQRLKMQFYSIICMQFMMYVVHVLIWILGCISIISPVHFQNRVSSWTEYAIVLMIPFINFHTV